MNTVTVAAEEARAALKAYLQTPPGSRAEAIAFRLYLEASARHLQTRHAR